MGGLHQGYIDSIMGGGIERCKGGGVNLRSLPSSIHWNRMYPAYISKQGQLAVLRKKEKIFKKLYII